MRFFLPLLFIGIAVWLGINLTAPAGCPTDDRSDCSVDILQHEWGFLGIDRSSDDDRLRIRGVQFQSGFGTHARSGIRLKPRGEFKRFTGMCGIDDETRGSGTVECKIVIDGVERFSSGRITGMDAATRFDVDVAGARTVDLITTDGDDGSSHDHLDWVVLRFMP